MLLTKPQKTLILCSIFIAGLIFCLLDVSVLFAVILVSAISFLNYKKIFSIKFSALCLIVAVFALFYPGFKTPKPDELYNILPVKSGSALGSACYNQSCRDERIPRTVFLKGRVISEPASSSDDRTKFEFLVSSYKFKTGDPKIIKAKTLVNIYDKQKKFKNISMGDVIEVRGYVKSPYEATNPGQFDYKNYLKIKSIFTITSVKTNDYNIIEHPKSGQWFVMQSLNKLKNKIFDENKKYLKSPKIEVLEGMVFGDIAVPAPDEIKQEFLKSGLLHLLAASGMNVGFIIGAWYLIATGLRVPYKPKLLAGAVLVVFYALMTGVPPSIMRAAVMTEFLIFAKLVDRKADNIILLVFVCAFMLLINPFLLLDISFQLSFVTTFGLLLCMPILMEKTKPVPELLSGALIVPIVAQIWASPVQVFHFNNFAVYSVIANILVIPFVEVISFLGFTGNILGLLPGIGNFICILTDKIVEPFINIVLYISGYFSNLPHSLYYFATPEIPGMFIFYGFVVAVLFALKKNFSSKKINTIVLILFLSLLFFTFKNNFVHKFEIVFFDVGQGDGMLVHLPDNRNFMVDTGPGGRFLPAKTAILPYLRNHGIHKLDAVLLTHQDYDHIGGALELLKDIKVDNVFHTGLKDDTKTCRKLKNYILLKHIKNKILSDGDNINFDKDVKIKVIRDQTQNTKNEGGIILYITYKDFSALLTADCEADALYDIENYVKKPLNILKIGHHGSYKSVDYDYLSYLKPQSAVISVGKWGYKYGHPSRHILEELQDFNVKTFRTDRDYAVTVSSDGNNYTYETYSGNK